MGSSSSFASNQCTDGNFCSLVIKFTSASASNRLHTMELFPNWKQRKKTDNWKCCAEEFRNLYSLWLAPKKVSSTSAPTQTGHETCRHHVRFSYARAHEKVLDAQHSTENKNAIRSCSIVAISHWKLDFKKLMRVNVRAIWIRSRNSLSRRKTITRNEDAANRERRTDARHIYDERRMNEK